MMSEGLLPKSLDFLLVEDSLVGDLVEAGPRQMVPGGSKMAKIATFWSLGAILTIFGPKTLFLVPKPSKMASRGQKQAKMPF